MIELIQKRQSKRSAKPFPLMNLIRTNNSDFDSGNKKVHSHQQLGSGLTSPIITNSIVRNNDPYMPQISQRSNSSVSLPQQHHHTKQHPVCRSTNSSTPHLVTHQSHQPVIPTNNEPQQIHHYHYYFSPPTSPCNKERFELADYNTSKQQQQQPFYSLYHQNISSSTSQLPPLSPPPLSPTNVSFATASRPSWRDIKRSPTWQPASSISSSEEEDDDDNEPLALQLGITTKPFSLLSDVSEDGDDELIPIARLSISSPMSAAEKYKAKVRAKLQMDTDPLFA